MDFHQILAKQKKDAARALGRSPKGWPRTNKDLRERIWSYWAHEINRVIMLRGGNLNSERNRNQMQRFLDSEYQSLSEFEFWGLVGKTMFAIKSEYDGPTDWEMFAEAWDETVDEYIDWAKEKAGDVADAAKSGLTWVILGGAGLAGLAAWAGSRKGKR